MLRHPAVPWIAPFVAFLCFIALGPYLPFGLEAAYPLRVIIVAAILFAVSRPVLKLELRQPVASAAMGVAVFLIWVGPEALIPGYRDHWLFHNSVLGMGGGSVPEGLKTNIVFLIFRCAGTFLLVPVIEELFWRGWLMRWLENSQDFRKVALGSYAPAAFWISAVLFASEHGPYWEVGLIAGALYNWWMVRTKSLGDCMLAHAVTNFCLAVYVLTANQWQYWL